MIRRRRRVNELIRDELSELIARRMKDPRLGGLVTVTEVDASPDMRQASVFISIMGSEAQVRETLDGLRAASGFLRRELAERLSLRNTPELAFKQDKSLEHGSHLLELMRRLAAGGGIAERG